MKRNDDEPLRMDWPGPKRPKCPGCKMIVLVGQPCVKFADGVVIHEHCEHTYYPGVAFDELPGSWPALFGRIYVPEVIMNDDVREALNSLVSALKYLIDACPDNNAMQVAARLGRGRIMGDVVAADNAVQMIRASALVELMQEAQKEKSSVSAYKRMQKALRTVGIDNAQAVNLVLHALEYHTRDGKPMEWLARKLTKPGV